MSEYYCIYQSTTSKKITNPNAVVTASGCSCHGYCKSHHDLSKQHSGYSTEGLANILEICIGHKLPVTNYRGYSFPEIYNKSNITSILYNTLRSIINAALDLRKEAKYYAKADKGNIPPAVSNRIYIKNKNLTDLNAFIANSAFYKDIVKAPSLTIDNKEIKTIDINKSINAIKTILNDCICYSDCNGYSSCTCYGHCNHY